MTIVLKQLPEPGELPIPQNVYQRLYALLIEPFEQDVGVTRAFWNTYGCLLAYIDTHEALTELRCADDETAIMVKRCLAYPETKDELPDGFEVWLTITNDEGGGTYLLLSKDALKGVSHER